MNLVCVVERQVFQHKKTIILNKRTNKTKINEQTKPNKNKQCRYREESRGYHRVSEGGGQNG